MLPSICLIPLAIISSEAAGGEGRGGEGRGGETCDTHVVVIRQSCSTHVIKYDVIHLEASSTFLSSLAKSTTSGKRFSAVLARKCSRVVFWSADLVELSWSGRDKTVKPSKHSCSVSSTSQIQQEKCLVSQT